MADMGFLPAVQQLLDQTPRDPPDAPVLGHARRRRRRARPPLPARPGRATSCPRHDRHAARHAPCSGRSSATSASQLTRRRREARRPDDRVLQDQARRRRARPRSSSSVGVRTEAIHGNRSQGQREPRARRVRRRQGRRARRHRRRARGIHVDDVACVVHFDPPDDAKDYMHRSGRTARAGAEGTVVSFVSRGTQQREVGARSSDRWDCAAASSAPTVTRWRRSHPTP